jgi:membrane protein implicated in regulation of membrane protease activity
MLEKWYCIFKGGPSMILTNIDFQLVGIIVWVVVFFVAVIIESLEPQLVSLWFAGGALVALLFATLFQVNLVWQVLLFIVTSVVLLILTKPFVNRVSSQPVTPTNADVLIGKEILVEKGFGPKQSGMGLQGDVRWKLIAKGDVSFKAGEFAMVEEITGNKLTVIKKKEGK